jgi:hypothetical protein
MPWNEAWVLDIRDIRGHVFGCIRGQTTIYRLRMNCVT